MLELNENDISSKSEKFKNKINEIPLEIVTKYGVCCGKTNKFEQVSSKKLLP